MLSFHLWKIDQVFSSADGKVQFIELHDPANGESHVGGHFISSNENKFAFPADLPSNNTANMHFLIGTRSYAALPGAVRPDYVVPDNFFNPNGDTFDYADVDSFTFTAGQLPSDGVAALFRDVSGGNLSTGKNLENNLAGQSASVTLAAPAANLTVSNSAPASERAGTPFTYTINVNNRGNATATGATVSDTLPAGLLNVSAVDSAGAVQVSGGQITDALGSLPGGASETLTITATPAAALDGTTLSDTASLTFNGATQTSTADTTIGPATPAPPGTAGIGILNGVPGDGSPRTFVQNLYRELLGREPDPVGDSQWIGLLEQQNNASGRAAVIQGIMNSSEYRTHLVSDLYQVFLGRAPEPAGLAFWIAKLQNPGTAGQHSGGADEKSVLADILGSGEFFSRSGGTVSDWVESLYKDIFGRAAESAGISFWSNAASLGSRGAVALDVLGSPEAAHDLLDSFFPLAGGTSGQPLGAPGTPAGVGQSDLALLTGSGWENAYLQGPFGSAPPANDAFFASLADGGDWDDIQLELLGSSQFYTNANRPLTT